MRARGRRGITAALLVLCLPAQALAMHPPAPPQTPLREACEKEVGYRPEPGQKGKDAIWAATPDEFVTRMLRMAGTSADDYVIDLGAGDGNFAIAAARQFGARSLGIEYNAELVKLAQCMVRGSGAEGRARVVEGDVFKADFSRADVLTIFLLPHLNQCLRHRILEMRPGVRVASYLFSMGDWEPDDMTAMGLDVAFLWVVPARVGGRWAFREPGSGGAAFTVDITQIYQKIGGEVVDGGTRHPLLGASLRGDLLRFSFRDAKGVHQNFTGRVAGREIAGDLRAADGESAEVVATLQGGPRPSPWAEMAPRCGKFYGK
ncbi:MAG: class I SAM-dependent methyltransferase [Burkholderiales bacterium]|nr:class I SAM-dependent methyltransferase [Burkholderiales bacterium]